MVTTLTGKNQVTVPAKLVQELRLHPGVRLDWFIGPDKTLRARRLASKQELSANLAGRGRRFLTSGTDPIAALVAERAAEEE
jgi:bifunctional DNA-binding transcriptional regulator/antitoxin component of YhaV-PrlF toxin-antitoxin module